MPKTAFLPSIDRVVLVRGALDRELAAGVHEPHPAAAEAADAGLVHLFLEAVEAAERAVDRLRDLPDGAPPLPGPMICQNIVWFT
jgi:hypothetical protein